MSKIIDISKKISYPKYNLNYMDNDYYEDKFLYLISAEIFKKYRHYPEYITLEEDLLTVEKKTNI